MNGTGLPRSLGFILLTTSLALVAACNSSGPMEPSTPPAGESLRPSAAMALSTYFPPSEATGGWRKKTNPTDIRALGINPTGLADFGAYLMGLPWENFSTGISGYDPSYKASLVIKNGWIVGEYSNTAAAKTAMYYLASNGKSFAIMLLGRMILDYPGLGITLSSKLYDQRWLPEGFPLSDPRKADITLDHLLRHISGIVPEAQAAIASVSVSRDPAWNFAPYTVGKDLDFSVSAPLYFNPGDPSTYSKDPYSSTAFNHLSLVFRNVTGTEAGTYLRNKILNPIGVGRMAYITSPGMGSYVWATGGNNLASARDYARLGYLLLHEGTWAGKQIFTASWIRQFTTVAGYPNINSNADCRWGTQYPKDMYRIVGSGVNLAWVVPSLDLVATFNGRTPNKLRDEVSRTFLQKLFASITDQYVTCDGRVINTIPLQTSASVTTLRLINADTDQPILTMTDGMTINLADLPTRNLNIQALTSPSAVGSVRFALDANSNYRTETAAPYALAGDDTGNYRPWTPGIGAHTVTATPYAGTGGTGTAGIPLKITFTVH